MSSEAEVVISAQGLGKAYQIFAKPEDRLKQFIWGRRRTYHEERWAVRDIDLDVRRGECFGIVGRNGSGKSTLLQMICGTLTPTVGSVDVRGRVAALLELGAGFNPEFTGRENVHLNATLLGMSPEEIAGRFADIEAFADIGAFIDEPVKHYSSGMYARLAFAVAVHTDPDVLVVDEALSVGDELFQSKCYRFMAALQERGVTILFVSHSSGLVRRICERVLVLDKGQPVFLGPSGKAIEAYNDLLFGHREQPGAVEAEAKGLLAQLPTEGGRQKTILRHFPPHDDQAAAVTAVGVLNQNAANLEFDIGQEVTFVSEVVANIHINKLITGMMIALPDGTDCYHTNTLCRSDQGFMSLEPGEKVTTRFTMKLDLAPGVYVARFDCQSFDQDEPRQLSIIYEALRISVLPAKLVDDGGVAYLRAQIDTVISNANNPGSAERVKEKSSC